MIDALYCDSEDEDEEAAKAERERKRIEALQARKKKAEQKRKELMEEENRMMESRAKIEKPDHVSLSDALEIQLILIGDDNKRSLLIRTRPKIVEFFQGKRNELEKSLCQVTDRESLKKYFVTRFKTIIESEDYEEDDYELMDSLKEFNDYYLKALLMVTKIRENVDVFVKNNYHFFEEARVEAHRRVVESKKDDFRDIYALFAEQREEEERRKKETERATRRTIENHLFFSSDTDIDSLIDEFTNVTIDLESGNSKSRDTSPVRYRDLLSESAMDKLIAGTQHLRISKKERDRMDEECTPSTTPNRVHSGGWMISISESESSSDDSDDIEQALWRINEKFMDRSRVVVQVKEEMPEINDEEFSTALSSNLGRGSDVIRPRKMNVQFVEYESPFNKMRLFCEQLDWYLINGNAGVTIFNDKTLCEGWSWKAKKFGNNPIAPQRKSGFKKFIESDRTSDAVLFSEEMSYDSSKSFIGDIDGRFCFDRNTLMKEEKRYVRACYDFVLERGFLNYFSRDEMIHPFVRNARSNALAFREFYGRELYNSEKNHPDKNPPCYLYRRGLKEMANVRLERHIQNQPIDEWTEQEIIDQVNIELNATKDYRRVATVWVFTDWRLHSLKEHSVTNAQITWVPTILGDLFFSNLKRAIRATFEAKSVGIKNIVFAFGGNDGLKIESICKLLTYVHKLTANRNVNIHWISCCTTQRVFESDENIYETSDESLYMVTINKLTKLFIEKMKERGIKNVHYADLSPYELTADGEDKSIEEICLNYLNYFEKQCGVFLSSRMFSLHDRPYDRYMEDEARTPHK